MFPAPVLFVFKRKKTGVTASPPIFCKVIRSALALKRTASAAARCVNCSSSWGRPMGDPSASKGASPPLGPDKKTRLPQLSPLWWVLDGWCYQVHNGSHLKWLCTTIAPKWARFLAGHHHPAVPSSASPWSMLPVIWRPKLLQNDWKYHETLFARIFGWRCWTEFQMLFEETRCISGASLFELSSKWWSSCNESSTTPKWSKQHTPPLMDEEIEKPCQNVKINLVH